MGAPTHKPGCETLFFRPARCQPCDQIVYFWGCSCGSRVLFDSTEKPWPKHRCSGSAKLATVSRPGTDRGRSKGDGPPGIEFISTYTYGVSSVVCMRCGKKVRKRDMPAHNYWTHGLGERPGDPVKRRSSTKPPRSAAKATGPKAEGKSSSKRLMVTCKVCNQSVRQSRLGRHMAKAHPGSPSTSTPQLAPGASPTGHGSPSSAAPTKPVAEREDRDTRAGEVGSKLRDIDELSPRELCAAVSLRVYEAGRIEKDVLMRDVARSLSLDSVPRVRSGLENALAALVLIGTLHADGEQVWRPDLNQGSARPITKSESPTTRDSGTEGPAKRLRAGGASIDTRPLREGQKHTSGQIAASSTDVRAALYRCLPQTRRVERSELFRDAAAYLGLRKLKREV
ncbi:MAG: hypothetical protein AVDCRST_MAG93-8094, partial [uncultured Chloroflexia bacterium]